MVLCPFLFSNQATWGKALESSVKHGLNVLNLDSDILGFKPYGINRIIYYSRKVTSLPMGYQH